MACARALVAALLFGSLGAAALAQSLAEIAERDKARRKGGATTKVYTNEDLAKGASPAEKDKPSARPSPTPTVQAERRDSRGAEAAWRTRAQTAREAIQAAEARIKELEGRIAALSADVVPTGVGDPFRLQTLETQRAQAREGLEKAREAASQARKNLEDLEEEARRGGVPPGWLREP